MTNEEASTAIKTWAGAMKNTYGHNDFAREFIEAAEMAILPLEKQIPKRPIKKTNYLDDIFNARYCPCCDACFDRKTEYCCFCGQAIDWDTDFIGSYRGE